MFIMLHEQIHFTFQNLPLSVKFDTSLTKLRLDQDLTKVSAAMSTMYMYM